VWGKGGSHLLAAGRMNVPTIISIVVFAGACGTFAAGPTDSASLSRACFGDHAADSPEVTFDDWTVSEVPDPDSPTSVVGAPLPEGGALLLLGSGAALILARHRLPRRRLN